MSIRERMRIAWQVVTYGTGTTKNPVNKTQEPVGYAADDFSFLPW